MVEGGSDSALTQAVVQESSRADDASALAVEAPAPKEVVPEAPKPAVEGVEGAPVQPEVIAKGKKEEGAAAPGAAPAASAAGAPSTPLKAGAPAAEGDKKKVK